MSDGLEQSRDRRVTAFRRRPQAQEVRTPALAFRDLLIEAWNAGCPPINKALHNAAATKRDGFPQSNALKVSTAPSL